jgi:CheY-like chemotaxis protein
MASILLIDDDDQVRLFLQTLLESEGHSVRQACNGAEGVRRFTESPPDLVLCDVFMPEQDGLETLRTLRGRHPGVKIITISGGSEMMPEMDFLRLAKGLGAARVLPKPLRPKAVMEAVRDVLQSAAV